MSTSITEKDSISRCSI